MSGTHSRRRPFRISFALVLLLATIGVPALQPLSGTKSVVNASQTAQNMTRRTYLPVVTGRPAVPLLSDQELIAQALKAGRIDYGTSLLYRFYALFADPRLPQAFRGSGSEGEDGPLFVQATDPALPADVKATLRPFLVRPDHPESVHNATLTQNVASSTQPASITCNASNWGSVASIKPGVTVSIHAKCVGDYDVELRTALGHMESLWGPMTALMGLPIPDAGGLEGSLKNDIDIYLMDPLDVTWRDNIQVRFKRPVLGSTATAAPYIGNRSSGYVMLARSTVRTHQFRSTLAHEFFHVLQNAHNSSISFQDDMEWWYTEASATWAETHFVQETAASAVHPLFADYFQQQDIPLHRSAGTIDQHEAANTHHMYAAYIWPFFIEQEVGPQAIADSWKAIANAGTDWDRGLAAIDEQLPFGLHFHRFALRNLNSPFGNDNPLKTRYVHLDTSFPDGVMPSAVEDVRLSGRAATDPPLQYSHPLPSLRAHYYHFTFDGSVKQVTFDFSKMLPLLNRKVGAVIKMKDKPWEMRELVADQMHFCRDKPEQAIEDLWIVVSNHNTDLAQSVLGPLEVKPMTDPCSCNPALVNKLQAVKQWQGSVTWTYSIAGADDDLSIKQQRSANISVVLNTPSGDTRTFIGSPTGGGTINDQTLHNGRLQMGLNGSGAPIPYDPATNEWSRVTLNFDWDTCQYNFGSSTFLNVIMTSDGDTPSETPFDIGSLHSGQIPIAGLLQSGGGAFPAHTPLYNPGVNEHVYTQQDFQLMQILGENKLGVATVSWSFNPVIPSTP